MYCNALLILFSFPSKNSLSPFSFFLKYNFFPVKNHSDQEAVPGATQQPASHYGRNFQLLSKNYGTFLTSKSMKILFKHLLFLLKNYNFSHF